MLERLTPTAAAAAAPPPPHGRGGPGRFALGATLGAAALAALGVLVAFGLSATWIALICMGMVGAGALLWSRDAVGFLLCTYFFTLPLVVTKAIVKTGGVYTPGLELSLSDLSLMALAVVWLVRYKALARARAHPQPATPVVLAYLGWMVVCAASSIRLTDALLALVTVLKFVVGAYLVADLVRTVKDLRRIIIVSAAGMCLQLAMAAAQFVTKSPLALQGAKVSTIGVSLSYESASTAFRPSGFLLHPIVFAAYLVMMLPLPMLFITLGARRVGRRAWCASVVLAVGGIAALVTTLSRGGWIVFACSTVFVLVVGRRRGLVARRHLIAAALVSVIGPATVLAVYPTVWDRLTKRDFRSLESRLLMMDQAQVIIRESPWFGVGLAGYNQTARVIKPPSFARVNPEYRKVITRGVVHNAFLLIWAERGVVGLALTILLYATYLRSFFRVRAWAHTTYHALAFALVAGLVAQLTFYMFDHFYMDLRPGLLWAWFGLLTAVLRINAQALAAGARPERSIPRAPAAVVVAARGEPRRRGAAFIAAAGAARRGWS